MENSNFVALMLRIYRDAAALQYAEAERLMCLGLAAKESADAMMLRCADLVAENLDDEGEIYEPEPESIAW